MNQLSDQELIDFTRASQPGKQRNVLDNHGIFYVTRLDGSITTTWHHINHPHPLKLAGNDTPDFGALSNG